MEMFPKLRTSFQQGGIQGVALLGPGGSTPDLPVDGLQLSIGLQVHLYEEDEDVDGTQGCLHADGIVAGWNEKFRCWFATYEWDALKWTPALEGSSDPITFDQWVREAFAHEVVKPGWWWKADTEWNELPPPISLEYLRRLFEDSGRLLSGYTDAQVDQGLWFLLGPGSTHVDFFMDLRVDWLIRLRTVQSILNLFAMFGSRCSSHLSHLDEPGANPLNSICYMFWDIIPLHGRPDEPAYAELDHSLLKVMTEILALPSDACRESALHGLGHWQPGYPKEVEQIVDSIIAGNSAIRPELRRYAEKARCGCVL